MHALMSAILLRRGRMDEVRLDAELDPPRRQARKTACAARPERRPIIAADRKRQAMSVKCLFKDRLRSFDRLLHDPHIDQKTTVAIRYRQWVDPAAVCRAEPAFEVGGPLVVGRGDRSNGSLLINRPAPPLDRCNQPGLLENAADRRRRWPAGLGSLTLKYRQQLTRPQMRKAFSQRNNYIRQRSRGLVRAMQWSVRTIHKPIRPAALSPFTPFVKRIAANPVSTTQIRHAPVPGLVIRQHPNTLFHATSLLKRHRRFSLRCSLTCRPSTRSKLSAIYPVCTTTTPTPNPSPAGCGLARFRQTFKVAKPRQAGDWLGRGAD